MPTIENIQRALKRKDKLITAAIAELNALFDKMGVEFANAVARIVGTGEFDVVKIRKLLESLGYDEAVTQALAKFDDLLKESAKFSAMVGVDFVFSSENELKLQNIIALKAQLFSSFKDFIATNMANFAAESALSQNTFANIVAGARELIGSQFRHIETEVHTALTTFDRTSKLMLYDQAGIKKFFYAGPEDKVTRDTCRAALDSKFQKTGWTMADIAAFPGIDFVLGGSPFFNCRHEFVPFGK